MGTKIKDAQLLESVTGVERIPVSDGSGNPKAVTTEALKNFVGASGGGGIPIVDSEEKLKALDLPQGSLASVAFDTIRKVSFRDLYQPTTNDFDMSTGLLVNPDALSKVDKLEFTFPEGLQSGESVGIYLVPKTFGMNNQKILAIEVWGDNGVVTSVIGLAMLSGYSSYPFCQYDDNGVLSINQENIDTFNELLTTDDWCYFSNLDTEFSITEAQFDLLDKFVKSVSGVQGTDSYINTPNGWENLAKRYIPKQISDFENNEGFIKISDVFRNYTIDNTKDTSNKTFELIPETLIYFKDAQYSINVQISQIPKPLTKFGVRTNQLIKFPNNYIKWEDDSCDELHADMVILTYSGDGNVFYGKRIEYDSSHVMNVSILPSEEDETPLFNEGSNLLKIGTVTAKDYERNPQYKYPIKEKTFFQVELNSISSEFFRGNAYIKTLHSNVDIEDFAFENCTSLLEVTFGDNINNVGSSAFKGCSSIHTVLTNNASLISQINFKDLESNPTYIGEGNLFELGNGLIKDLFIDPSTNYKYYNYVLPYTYAGCKSLESVELGDKIEYVSKQSFYKCINLKKFKAGKETRVLVDYCFDGCISLQVIDFSNWDSSVSGMCLVYEHSLDGIPSSCQIIVPDKMYNTWVTSQYWSNYASQIVKASEYVEPTNE